MNAFLKFLGHDQADVKSCLQAFYPSMKPASVLISTDEGYDRWVERYDHNAQVYISVNPVRMDANLFIKDVDIAYWCNEYIDLDGEKPSKDLKGYNATEDELERLKPFVEKINNWLTDHGFKTGYCDMSGNGYRWILPIPPLKLDGVNIEQLVAKKKAFKERLEKDIGLVPGCGAAIDSVFDLKRITGVPGTENVKLQLDDRPCRTREPFRGAVRDEDQNLRDYIMLMETEAVVPITTAPRTHTKTLEELMKKDPKLKQLVSGDNSGYPSPSEADMALASKLVFYNFNDVEIEGILISVPGSDAEKKEKAGNHQYVTRTIAKAVSWGSPRIEHRQKTQDAREMASVAVIKFFNDYLDLAQQMQAHNPIHYDGGKNYWVWSIIDKSYHHADETDILIAIQDAADLHHQIIKSRDKSEMLEAIRITGRRFTPKDVPANWIQFKDCVVNIDTEERFDATPEHFFVAPIPHCCGSGTETPVIDKLFSEWVAEPDRPMLYEIIAYCLYTRYPIHRIFFLLGAGRNGKSQYMGIVKHLLGREGWTSSTIEMLLENRFEGAKLYKKHAVFIGETDFKMIKKTDMLKRMSGDDPIRCEFKGKNPIDFDNYAKLIIGTNSIPETADTTKGYYSRFVIVDFPNEFDLGKPIIDSISEEEYENLCHRLVLVLKKLLNAGKFSNEGTLEERKQRYIKKASSLTAFIEERCDIGVDEMEPFWKFYNAYGAYTEVSGHRTLSKTAVGRWLSDEGYEREQERWGEKNWLTIFGLCLREVKQSTLTLPDLVDGVDGVDGFPTHPSPRILTIKPSTPSTPSTNRHPTAIPCVDGVDGSGQQVNLNKDVCICADLAPNLTAIKTAIFTLDYSFSIKQFNVVQLLIKGRPNIPDCTTELLTQLLDEHLEELKLIKIDDKTYKQVK